MDEFTIRKLDVLLASCRTLYSNGKLWRTAFTARRGQWPHHAPKPQRVKKKATLSNGNGITCLHGRTTSLSHS